MSSIKNVDYVTESDSPNGVEIIKRLNTDVYFKGPDYINIKEDFTGYIKKEINAVNKGRIVYGSGKHSSSEILNKISNFNLSQKKTINEIKKNNSFDSISKKI